MSPSTRRAVLLSLRGPLALLLLYAGVDALFTMVAARDGLLTPFGTVHLSALLLGLLALVCRLLVVFVLLPWAVFAGLGACAGSRRSR